MKDKFLFLLRIASASSLVLAVAAAGSARHVVSVVLTQEKTAKVSDGENKGALAINSAPDAAAKLAATGEFVKKYPKSTLLPQITSYVAGQIAQVPDATQKLTLAEGFQKLFKDSKEAEEIELVTLDAYLSLKRVDDAFAHAASILAKKPENLSVMSHMALVGTEEAKRQNAKHVPVSIQYGVKSIELIEANKKPADLDDARWEKQKAMLPLLYLDMGILSLVSSNPADAKARFEKASVLNPAEPTSYALLANIVDGEYQQFAKTYRTMPDGKQKEEILKNATERMDKAIDLYARALAASAGKPEHKQLEAQLMEAITPYYKYRHNGSTDGLKELIDKYKTPSTP